MTTRREFVITGVVTTGLLWFTMPYVENESLHERLRRQHQLPLDDTLRIDGDCD